MSALELASLLIDLVLKLIDAPQAKQLLDQKVVEAVNAAADAAENAKFGA